MTDDLKAPETDDIKLRLRGRAAHLYDRGEIKSPSIMIEAADRIAALEAALADMTQQRDAAMAGAVKVRELVWEEEPRNGWKIGVSHAAGYRLVRLNDGWHYGKHDGWVFDTLEAAKAAAQADHEARILCALTPDPDRLLALTAAAEAQAEARGMRKAAGLPHRVEKLGGQSYAYVRVEEILALADATEAAAKGWV